MSNINIVANSCNICYNVKMLKVFFSDISGAAGVENAEILCRVRKEYTDGIKEPYRKRQSVLVWKLLEYVFYRYFSIKDVVFSLDKSGKWTSDQTDLFFSLSHSGNIVAVAVSDSERTGVDVEKVSEKIFKLVNKLLINGNKSTNDGKPTNGNKSTNDSKSSNAEKVFSCDHESESLQDGSSLKNVSAEYLTFRWTEKESAFKSASKNPVFTSCFVFDKEKNRYCLTAASDNGGMELIKVSLKELI